MSVTFQVADIVNDIRGRLALPTFTTTTRITQARALAQIQQSARSLAALTRQKLGRDYDLIATATLATQAGLNLVSVPANFGELVKICWLKSATEAPQLQQAMASDYEPMGFNPRAWDEPYSGVPGGYGVGLPRYDLEGATLTFYPCPNQIYSLAIWYTLHYPVVTLADTIQGRLDWDKWIALDTCVALCSDLKRDPTIFGGLRTALEADLFAAKRKRDMNAVHAIRDAGAWGENEEYARVKFWGQY
jgi:hypothetical protein